MNTRLPRTREEKCPHCSRTFDKVGAKTNHIQKDHAAIEAKKAEKEEQERLAKIAEMQRRKDEMEREKMKKNSRSRVRKSELF